MSNTLTNKDVSIWGWLSAVAPTEAKNRAGSVQQQLIDELWVEIAFTTKMEKIWSSTTYIGVKKISLCLKF